MEMRLGCTVDESKKRVLPGEEPIVILSKNETFKGSGKSVFIIHRFIIA